MSLPQPRFAYRDPVPAWDELGRCHLVPIGGIGLSAVARLLLARHVPVSGSDAKDSPLVRSLVEEGAVVAIGDRSHPEPLLAAGLVEDADTLVVNAAVREDHPELARARERGLRVLHRAQALTAVTAGTLRVVVAGANGKTSTSSMLTVGLQGAALDPTFALGGELQGAGTNAWLGTSPVSVIEGDESDQSFLAYGPDLAVVTSVQPDHLDHYGTVEAVVQAYRAFVDTITRTDAVAVDLVVNVDDPGARDLADYARGTGLRVLGYGHREDADARIEQVELAPDGSTASIRLSSGVLASEVTADTEPGVHELRLIVPGMRNVENATAAFAVAAVGLGVDAEAVLGGLHGFTGTRRRFERVGQAGGVSVVDDYAHNPSKVASVVETGRAVVPAGGRLVVLFQPHLYSRTRDFADAFGAALALADVLVVTDVYGAREQPMPGVSGRLVASAAEAHGAREVHWAPTLEDAVATLLELVGDADLVVTVGAGDVTEVGPVLLTGLTARAEPGDGDRR